MKALVGFLMIFTSSLFAQVPDLAIDAKIENKNLWFNGGIDSYGEEVIMDIEVGTTRENLMPENLFFGYQAPPLSLQRGKFSGSINHCAGSIKEIKKKFADSKFLYYRLYVKNKDGKITSTAIQCFKL